jgi:hypothetical protein
MNELKAQAAPVSWWTAGILLGLVQVLAIALAQPLDVSNQFVVADAKTLQRVAPEYAENHPLIQALKEQDLQSNTPGLLGLASGWWLTIGLVLGAFLAALHLKTWKIRVSSAWWRQNHADPVVLRLISGFCGGFCALLGAGLAYGSIVGLCGSGWAQLAVSAIPFTIAALSSGMLIAYLVYRKAPNKDRQGL